LLLFRFACGRNEKEATNMEWANGCSVSPPGTLWVPGFVSVAEGFSPAGDCATLPQSKEEIAYHITFVRLSCRQTRSSSATPQAYAT
jgi:hypothetical protein